MRVRQRVPSIIFLLFTLLASACVPPASTADGSGPGLEGTLTVTGAWALYPLMVRWTEAFQLENPGVTIDVSAGGAGKGMADALAGAADLGMVSREIYPEELNRGAVGFPVAKDAVFVTVNAGNPELETLLSIGLTDDILRKIYITSEITTWGQAVGDASNTDPIHVFTRSDAAGAPATFAAYLGYAQEDLQGIGVYGDPGLIAAVVQDPLGIGYNNLNYAFDPETGLPVQGTRVIPLDGNDNRAIDPEEVCATKEQAVRAVASGAYPSPPARALYLVSSGSPSGLAREFLRWILTSGQDYVEQVGYIPLPAEMLQAALVSLEGVE